MEDYTTCFWFSKGICRDHSIINSKGPPSKIRLRTIRNDRFYNHKKCDWNVWLHGSATRYVKKKFQLESFFFLKWKMSYKWSNCKSILREDAVLAIGPSRTPRRTCSRTWELCHRQEYLGWEVRSTNWVWNRVRCNRSNRPDPDNRFRRKEEISLWRCRRWEDWPGSTWLGKLEALGWSKLCRNEMMNISWSLNDGTIKALTIT